LLFNFLFIFFKEEEGKRGRKKKKGKKLERMIQKMKWIQKIDEKELYQKIQIKILLFS